METYVNHSTTLKKMVYLESRRWLPVEHCFKRARVAFDGNQEWCEALQRPLGEEIFQMGSEQAKYLASGGRQDGENDPVEIHEVKRVCALNALPYWTVRPHKPLPLLLMYIFFL